MGFKKLFQSDFIRNSSILISGNMIGQSIAFLVLPLLARLYSESEFGILATFTSITGLLTIIGTGRYEESLVIAKNKRTATLLLGFSFRILSVFSLMLFFVLLFLRYPIFSFFKIEALIEFWYLIPPSVFFTGLFFLFSNLATREKQFKAIASSSLIQNSSNSILKIIMGALSFTNIGLLLSSLLSLTISLLPFHRLKGYFKEMFSASWQEKKEAGMKFLTFPLHNAPRAFISSFSTNLPFLYLFSIFGEAKLGLFSLAFTLLYRPVNLLSNSLFSIFFEKTVSLCRNKESIWIIIKTYCLKCCLFLLPFFLLAYFIATPLFEFLFGENWSESSLYFQDLLPWMFVSILIAPFQFIPIVFQKQGKALWFEIAHLILRFSALFIGAQTFNFQTGIFLFSTVGFIFTSIQGIWYYSLIASYEKSIR